jgi:hypothetical protein
MADVPVEGPLLCKDFKLQALVGQQLEAFLISEVLTQVSIFLRLQASIPG